MEAVISDDKVLSGVRVLEVAAWTFVPSAGAVLAEWGAEVIKVEPARAATHSVASSRWASWTTAADRSTT